MSGLMRGHTSGVIGLALFVALAGGYLAYRLGLTVRAIRAERAGDVDRAGALRMRAVVLGLGISVVLTMALLVVVVLASR